MGDGASIAALWTTPKILLAALSALLFFLGVFLIIGSAKKAAEPMVPPCKKCGRVLLPEWAKCRFCGTSLHEVKPELEVVAGPLSGKVIGLQRDVTTIGSVAGNTILLVDTGVSRKHAGIRRVAGGFELADLGSTNGVYVNGEKVAKRKLEVGDVIRIGTSEMVFRT